MNPKTAKTASPTAPVKPEEALDADVADPGEVAKTKAEQLKKNKGKYGKTEVKPAKPPGSNGGDEPVKDSWIEIVLVDKDDQPVNGERFEITLPDGTISKGSTDAKGKARVEGFAPGSCKVSFPDVDKDAWAKA